MVSSVLRNGLDINTLMPRCRESWEYAASIGLLRKMLECKDKGWSSPPPPCLLGTRHTLYAGARVMGIFDGDCSLGGGG
jgi:hypothetical protein